MSLFVLNRIALRALTRNKLRASLTMLGIAIGVCAVICTVAIGEGASVRVREAISSVGANMVWIEAGGRNVNGVRTGTYGTKSLTLGDARAIEQQVPLVVNVSPHVDTRVQIVHGNQNWNTSVRGVAPEYLAVRDWPIARGTMFAEQQIREAANVCVLGDTVARMVFPGEDPIGQTMRVKDLVCRVIGVLAPKGQSATGLDQDDTFLMPYTTVQKKVKGLTWLDDIMCSAVSLQAAGPAEEQIAELLRARHRLRPGQPDDFNLRHPTEIAEAVERSANTMELLLAAIACVSLLVGGIGVMNIMLVSVTERTREIGIRMSVGARGGDVQRQFLWEAIVLSLMGGGVGTALGLAGAYALARALAWPVQVPAGAIVLAFGFSAAMGTFFGFYPAWKAAHLDPIDALRYEAA